VRVAERGGLTIVFIMMIVMSNGDRAICFGKLRNWGECSNWYWLLKSASDGQSGGGVWRRESWVLDSGFFMESFHI
jgi:hypothetical protein